jgi:hypothetical protein
MRTRTGTSRTRYILVSLGKGLLAGMVWQIGLIAGSVVASLLGFVAPPVPPGVDATLILPLGVLVGVPVAITLGELGKRLQQPFVPRVLILFLFNYLVYGLAQMLEQILFTTAANLGYGSASNLVQAALLALVVGTLWRPAEIVPFRERIAHLRGARGPVDWGWRLAVAWLTYVPIYWGMGRLVAPLVAPLYQAAEFGLVLPETVAMIDMQYLRGALYLLAVLPIILLWHGSRRALWQCLGFAILIQIAATPILLAYWYPLSFRLAHSLELAVASFSQAYVYAHLLFVAPAGPAGNASQKESRQ